LVGWLGIGDAQAMEQAFKQAVEEAMTKYVKVNFDL
jgi:ribosomal protein S5